MNPITLTFTFERATKNMNRYQETHKDGVALAEGAKPTVGTIYINRADLPVIPEGETPAPRTVVIS